MRSLLHALFSDQHGELDEATLVLPLLLLVSLGLVNLGVLGFSAVNAGNAANYGARMGSVAQSDPAGVAAASAYRMLSAIPVGEYSVSVSGNGQPGDSLDVQVSYSVPNFFSGLASFFGVNTPATFNSTVTSTFRQEGW
jgi:Flp pilus assembly protein TadG